MSAHEFPIPRPGFKYPWMAVVQFDQSQQDWAWGVYSQSRTTVPRWTGHAPTLEAAKQAALDAVPQS